MPCPAECKAVAAFNEAVAARLVAEAEQASDHRAAALLTLAAECGGLAARWAALGDASWSRPAAVRWWEAGGEVPGRYVGRAFRDGW